MRRPSVGWWSVLAAAVLLVFATAACSSGAVEDAEKDARTGVAPLGEEVAGVTSIAPSGDVELVGTAWLLSGVERDGRAVDIADAEVPAVVSFDADGVEAYDGVNTASGEYEASGGSLRVDLAAATTFAYPGTTLPQHRLLADLPRARSVTRDGDVLVIDLADGTALRFELAAGGAPG